MEVPRFTHVFFRNFAGPSKPLHVMFTCVLYTICLTQNFRAPLLIPNTPYIWAWNVPVENCDGKFDVPLDLRMFSLIGSPRKDATEQNVTLFDRDQLGYYPYINKETKKRVNGGIPSLKSLKKHLKKAKEDIIYYISKDDVGLAVIDWEEWLPLWDRNLKTRDEYKKLSMKFVQRRNILMNSTEVTNTAKDEFEHAAKDFMQETLRLGKSMRPNYLWGYFQFPDCYNDYNNPDYSGACSAVEMKRNDDLEWMWNESTALYPSVYLKTQLSSTPQATLFARNRIHEAIRLSTTSDIKKPIPVFVYSRPDFGARSVQYLSQVDLESIIGESVALGAAGVVLWGNVNLIQDRESCLNLGNFLKIKLNPYLINVTLAGKMCSQVLCQDQGTCTRKYWYASDYLHLNPKNFAIRVEDDGNYTVNGKPTFEDLSYFNQKFHCNCYPGTSCDMPLEMHKIKTIHVCTAADVCIDIFLNRKKTPHHSKSSHFKAKFITSSKGFSPTSPVKVSPCVPGKALRECDTVS